MNIFSSLEARNFWRCDKGATAIEYAVAASLISVALVLVFHTIGDTLAAMLTEVNDGL